MTTTRTRLDQCPTCKAEIDSLSGYSHDEKPEEGDNTVCFYCAAILELDKDFKVKEASLHTLHLAWQIPVIQELIQIILAEKEKKMPEHTPGPWQVEKTPGSYQICGQRLCLPFGDKNCIAFMAVLHENQEGDGQANARLMAAAPDMFSILEQIATVHEYSHLVDPHKVQEDIMEQIHNVLNKVKEKL